MENPNPKRLMTGGTPTLAHQMPLEATESQSSKHLTSELIGGYSGTKCSKFTWKFNVFDRVLHMSKYVLHSLEFQR